MSKELNRYLTSFSILLLTAALIAGVSGCGEGEGYVLPPSEDLEIQTWYDLDDVRNNLEGNHILMNSLNFTTPGYEELASPTANEGKGWEPIGIYHPDEYTAFIGFMGTFDGQGYEISDLFINRPDEDDVGLFKYVDGGVIENVGVTNVTVIGGDAAGALAGTISGGGDAVAVSNSHFSGNVAGNDAVGGVTGHASCTITDSYFTGIVTGNDDVGGLVGENHGTVSKSHFTGDVTGSVSIGGLVGANWGHEPQVADSAGTVSDCYSSGSVTGYEHVGGLIGFIGGTVGGTVRDSYSIASVNGEAGVGGLLGDNHLDPGPGADVPWALVNMLGVDVINSYYNLDESLINGESVITIGALSDEDFDQWFANNKFLDINERLSQENGYYLINDISDFRQLLVFGQNSTLKFRLTSDLNLIAEPGFYVPYLAGEFDGNGYEISNLNFNSDCVCYVGLFGYLCRDGEVNHVGIENINITGARFVGGLAGQSYGTVSDCYSTGSVTGNEWYVGGLVGWNLKASVTIGNNEWDVPGIVSNSYSTTGVSGGDMVGGLIGLNHGEVINSYSTGSVTGYEFVGGLIGWGEVSDSYFTGSVIGEDAVGGLAGFGIGSNSHYNYDEVLINGENIITGGALISEDFEEWLTNEKHLDVDGRLSHEDGYYQINDVNDFKQLLAVGQNASLKFRLTSDLNLATDPNFYIPYLAGEFNGNNHRISNLSFEFGFVSYVGLFGILGPGGNITQLGDENVNIVGNYCIGGLAGFNAGNVSYSYSTGSVSGHENVGGLVGLNVVTVSNSRSAAVVTGDKHVGGLVGNNDYGFPDADGIVSNSYSTGSVTGTSYVGGLVGVNRDTLNNSYSTASVIGYDHVGGLVGLGSASNSYSTGSVNGNDDVGGLVGRGDASNSFWDVQTSGRPTSDGGTGKTTAEMQNIATFTDTEPEGLDEPWDITTVTSSGERNPSYIWNIVDDVTYPFLSWQP
jgi:hypothetical protein